MKKSQMTIKQLESNRKGFKKGVAFGKKVFNNEKLKDTSKLKSAYTCLSKADKLSQSTKLKDIETQQMYATAGNTIRNQIRKRIAERRS